MADEPKHGNVDDALEIVRTHFAHYREEAPPTAKLHPELTKSIRPCIERLAATMFQSDVRLDGMTVIIMAENWVACTAMDPLDWPGKAPPVRTTELGSSPEPRPERRVMGAPR